MAPIFITMALDPEFIKKIQERKAKREALEQRFGEINNSAPKRRSSSTGGSRSRKSKQDKGPVYRSVSMLTGKEVILDGDNAQKLADRSKFHGQ